MRAFWPSGRCDATPWAVRSADRAQSALPGLALVDDQVEGGCLAGNCGEQAVRLAAVVGLVIEEMIERWR